MKYLRALLAALLLPALLFGQAIFAEGESTMPQLVQTKYETGRAVVADSVIEADGTGKADCSAVIQAALDARFAAGGGTVWLPAGHYRLESPITIPPFVTLWGDWREPDAGEGYGTVLLACVAGSDTALPALITVGGSAGAVGLTVYYPDQSIEQPKPYPFTFYVNGQGQSYMLQSVVNCTVINGWRGLGACVEEDNAHEQLTVDGFYGTFLCVGAEAYNQADVGTWKNVHISGRFWAEAQEGLEAAPREAIDVYMRENAVGLRLGDLEWTEFDGIEIDGGAIGIHIVKGKRIEFAGSIAGADVRARRALVVDSIDARWGMAVADSRFEGEECAIANNTRGKIKLSGVETVGALSGEKRIVNEESLGSLELSRADEPARPSGPLYVLEADGGKDVSAALQALLERASGGGIVYLPAGKYLLNEPIAVPDGVELRGAGAVASRDQSGLSLGTVILAGWDGAEPLVSVGSGAGVSGVRFVCINNLFTDGVREMNCVISAKGDGVFAENIGITAATKGISISNADGFLVKKLVCCCYENAISVSCSQNGRIEGCLQNGTVIFRNGVEDGAWRLDESTIWDTLFDPITRKRAVLIKLSGCRGVTVSQTFAYGAATLIEAKQSTGTRLVNVGADNLGSFTPLIKVCGGELAAVNVMRYNGMSYENDGAYLRIWGRLSINVPNEPAVRENAPPPTARRGINLQK